MKFSADNSRRSERSNLHCEIKGNTCIPCHLQQCVEVNNQSNEGFSIDMVEFTCDNKLKSEKDQIISQKPAAYQIDACHEQDC